MIILPFVAPAVEITKEMEKKERKKKNDNFGQLFIVI